MAPRKAVDQELSRKKIMDVARELFVANGFRETSMRQIAKELNYSHGAIYYHFENKAELFYTILQADFKLLDQELDLLLETDSENDEEKLKQVLQGYIEFGLTHQSHYECMFLMKDKELQGYLQSAPNQSYEKFAQAVQVLTPKSISPRHVWSLFLSLHGMVIHYCGHGLTYEDVKDLALFHAEFLIKSLR